MSIQRRFPILTIAAEAIVEAVRSALVFLRIYGLPLIVYTLALVAARVAWFEHSAQQQALPLWAEMALWTPFAGLISIAIFRYFDTGEMPQWWDGLALGRGFWAVMGCLLLVNLVYRYLPFWEQQLVGVIWQHQFGTNWALHMDDNLHLATLSRIVVQIGGFAVNALVGMFAMALVWIIATRSRLDVKDAWRLATVLPVSLFAYLLLFEVIGYQIGVLYNAAYYGLGLPMPGGPNSQFWRERVLPEFFSELPFLLNAYISNLIWFSALAVAFRYLDAQHLKNDAAPD